MAEQLLYTYCSIIINTSQSSETIKSPTDLVRLPVEVFYFNASLVS